MRPQRCPIFRSGCRAHENTFAPRPWFQLVFHFVCDETLIAGQCLVAFLSEKWMHGLIQSIRQEFLSELVFIAQAPALPGSPVIEKLHVPGDADGDHRQLAEDLDIHLAIPVCESREYSRGHFLIPEFAIPPGSLVAVPSQEIKHRFV